MSVQSPSPGSYERQVTLSYQFMNGHKQGGLEGGKNWLCIKLKFKIKVDQSKFFWACIVQYVIDKGTTAVFASIVNGRKLVKCINDISTQGFWETLTAEESNLVN